MSTNISVRTSRDGDQFHYFWAARRCLRLLSPKSGLVAVTIEGSSPLESATSDRIDIGEEVIDVAEYYGSENFSEAKLVRYVQLKHSTLRTSEPWKPSELEKTLDGFAQRYKEIRKLLKRSGSTLNLEFRFVTNRPVRSDIFETVEDLVKKAKTRHPETLRRLRAITRLRGSELRFFFSILRFDANQEGYRDQRNTLHRDLAAYLPEADADAPVLLKELITLKATSFGKSDPGIRKIDVLRQLKTYEMDLFPAPCLIEPAKNYVGREQESELVDEILRAGNCPVVIHADGGVGKSIIAKRIPLSLPSDSVGILYDCFGNGRYRNPSGYRHRHRDALVQISNELASMGLCDPLIPSPKAENTAYVKAFLHRIRQSVSVVKERNSEAVLCVIVDAADNAEIAAREVGDKRSFVRDLLREDFPDGFRLVTLCRTHRQEILDPPPDAVRVQLRPFSRNETARHLRAYFPMAQEHDIEEFDRLSSSNPRVQATALSRNLPLNRILRDLGPSVTKSDKVLEDLFSKALETVRDTVGSHERERIDQVCTGLAVLRPFVPISILASMAQIQETEIRSLAADFGRGILISGNAIQFLDEPTETWFRERFRPESTDLLRFIERLQPLASESAYVAAALPELMLKAGKLPELVDLALSSKGLPDTNPIERRDVELQRLQFALKASLRLERYSDTAKLALKAGTETAGHERQDRLLQSNTDLAARLLDIDRIQEIVSRRTFRSGWMGSHSAYEASILSGRPELKGDARSRLRMAEEWVTNWSRVSRQKRVDELVHDQDIAEMAIAHFNVYGANESARFLRRWTPREVSFRAGRILAERFVDHGRYSDLDDLAASAGNDFCLVLAVALELSRVNRHLADRAVRRTLRLLSSHHVVTEQSERWSSDYPVLRAITALIPAACRVSPIDSRTLTKVLHRFVPSPIPSLAHPDYQPTSAVLRAYCLQRVLMGQTPQLVDLARTDIRKEIEGNSSIRSREAQVFTENVGALLPWHQLWAEVSIGKIGHDRIREAVTSTKSRSDRALGSYFEGKRDVQNEIAVVWVRLLAACDSMTPEANEMIEAWIDELKEPLSIPTITELTRVLSCAASFEKYAFAYSQRAYRAITNWREGAESKTEALIDLARAILTASESEAIAFFDEAVRIASKVGDENLDRWSAMLDLAEQAAERTFQTPDLAYKLARCAELTYDYVARDKHFNWHDTVTAIAGLDAPSSFAILSRWRDRRFGRAERLLPAVTNFLTIRGDLDPRTALALIGFRSCWDKVGMLRRALPVMYDATDKGSAVTFCHRYLVFDDPTTETWEEFDNLVKSNDLEPPPHDELIDSAQPCHSATIPAAANQTHAEPFSIENRLPDWNAIFGTCDVGNASDVASAYRRYRCSEPPFTPGEFFKKFFARVRLGHEAQAITALAEVPELRLYDVRSIIESVPDDWKTMLSPRNALARATKTFCRRFSMEIQKNRHYESFPFELASKVANIDFEEIADTVLDALGEAGETLSSGRLFSLMSLLVVKLSRTEARDVLAYGTVLFDDELAEDDGDGPWSTMLTPPANTEDAVAGYVWAALASPWADVRWQATHVVRGWCALGCERPVRYLVELARQDSGGPFADRSLYFYSWHGRQWLLIALARSAREHPEMVAPLAPFMIEVALSNVPHVLVVSFAAEAVLTLDRIGIIQLSSEQNRRISTVNSSPFDVIVSSRYNRCASPRARKEWDENSFHFGLDSDKYWLQPLGECFGIPTEDIEVEVRGVIERELHYGNTGWPQEDQRHVRSLFLDSEASTYMHSNPPAHDIQFYLMYHALMIHAGRLLSRFPTHRDSEDPSANFAHWLDENRLARSDGGWLFDRRERQPSEVRCTEHLGEARLWRWSVSRAEFDRLLSSNNGDLNVWADWTSSSGERIESVSIRSALVSPDRSYALLNSLQTMSPRQCAFPRKRSDKLEYDCEDEIEFGAFRFMGWIAEQSEASGLDEDDPWAGGIRFPPYAPATDVVELMQLVPDSEMRIWRYDNAADQRAAFRSTVWGEHRSLREVDLANRGRRLQVSPCFVRQYLTRVQKHLLVRIEIRRHVDARYEGRPGYESGYYEPSARHFIVKADGSLCTI